MDGSGGSSRSHAALPSAPRMAPPSKGASIPRVNGTVPKGLVQGAAGYGTAGYRLLQQELEQSRRQQPWLDSAPPSGNGAGGSSSGMLMSMPSMENSASTQMQGEESTLKEQRQKRVHDLRSKFDRARLGEIRNRFNWSDRASGGAVDEKEGDREGVRRSGRREGSASLAGDEGGMTVGRGDLFSRLEGSVDNIQEAQEALEEMVEAEEEEREVEEVEDLLEYYLQRASATQDEAERLLAGGRRRGSFWAILKTMRWHSSL